ncbi:FixH family protein [Rhodobacteraceae bacterium XHP0102]|nr:FixH family protein [Rhodobacteraceae bacterium XHP0102]
MNAPANNLTKGRLTGAKFWMLFVGFFGLIIVVNLFMAYKALSTFPGLEVSSSYADSQDFDVRRDAQLALGWQASVETRADATGTTLILHLDDETGAPVIPAQMDALLTRPTNQTQDQQLALQFIDGAWQAPAVLDRGRWRLRLTGLADDGTEYRHNITFWMD